MNHMRISAFPYIPKSDDDYRNFQKKYRLNELKFDELT